MAATFRLVSDLKQAANPIGHRRSRRKPIGQDIGQPQSNNHQPGQPRPGDSGDDGKCGHGSDDST